MYSSRSNKQLYSMAVLGLCLVSFARADWFPFGSGEKKEKPQPPAPQVTCKHTFTPTKFGTNLIVNFDCSKDTVDPLSIKLQIPKHPGFSLPVVENFQFTSSRRNIGVTIPLEQFSDFAKMPSELSYSLAPYGEGKITLNPLIFKPQFKSESVDHANMLLIGEAGSGKTSAANTLVSGLSKEIITLTPAAYESTVSHTTKLREYKLDHYTNLPISIWDFWGIEKNGKYSLEFLDRLVSGFIPTGFNMSEFSENEWKKFPSKFGPPMDVVYVVMNSKILEQSQTNQKQSPILEIIRHFNSRGIQMILIATHLDKSPFDVKKIKNDLHHLTNIPIEKIFPITTYFDGGRTKRFETEKTVSMITEETFKIVKEVQFNRKEQKEQTENVNTIKNQNWNWKISEFIRTTTTSITSSLSSFVQIIKPYVPENSIAGAEKGDFTLVVWAIAYFVIFVPTVIMLVGCCYDRKNRNQNPQPRNNNQNNNNNNNRKGKNRNNNNGPKVVEKKEEKNDEKEKEKEREQEKQKENERTTGDANKNNNNNNVPKPEEKKDNNNLQPETELPTPLPPTTETIEQTQPAGQSQTQTEEKPKTSDEKKKD